LSAILDIGLFTRHDFYGVRSFIAPAELIHEMRAKTTKSLSWTGL